MRKEIERYYKVWENVERYAWVNKQRVEEIKQLLEKNWEFFGKRVVDLCCGAGILGIFLGKDREYLGIDINRDMIKEAKKWAKKFKVPAKFMVADVRDVKLDGKWDTFVCIGNSISHLSTKDVTEMIENITGMQKKVHTF